MIVSYFVNNFLPLVILLTLVTFMYVNKDVKIPASGFFAVTIGIMLALTVIGELDKNTDISNLTVEEAARAVRLRTWMSTLGYILRPCVILSELMIILHNNKYKLLCLIPAAINAVIYSTALFGSSIAFHIDGSNCWGGGPLSKTVYIVQILYLSILLYCSVKSFCTGEKRKSLILILMFVQAVLASVMEYCNYSGFTDSVTALCILEYYIYLSTVYRQELKEKLDKYVYEMEKSGVKFKNLTMEVMEALAGAIDAKDRYTNGHSRRVAEYSRTIAEKSGKSLEECDRIYFAALLHDVGKIGVPIEILTKKGRLTKEEFEQVKLHPVVGSQILSTISDHPWLSTGARFHHERYNGKGYPDGLQGEDIPEIARIIAVADAYDAMTSNRSYRDAIPQHIVREELVKGIGTQFDPEFARTMIHLIDLDIEYRMKESVSGTSLTLGTGLKCESIYNGCTDGIGITRRKTRVSLSSKPEKGYPEEKCLPTLIVFDELNGKVNPGEEDNKDYLYFEYAQIRLDGYVTEKNVRKSEVRMSDRKTDVRMKTVNDKDNSQRYIVEAVRNRDHLLVSVISEKKSFDVILALPDPSRYVFISITGENCEVKNIKVDIEKEETDWDAIPRIAEEISYIKNCPVGDIPSIQVDGPRLASTVGIPIKKGMELTFHSMSYPTARLVWHCPYFSIFSSLNGKVDGDDFREFLLLKLDGENWESKENVKNEVRVDQTEEFEGWNSWMEKNKQGIDCRVSIVRENNKITMQTKNLGIDLHSVTTLVDGTKDVYLALTGDQCAITDIRISEK